MEKECPFWAQQRMCNSNKCSICECEDKEIPVFWKKKREDIALEMREGSYAASHKLDFSKISRGSASAPQDSGKNKEWC